MRIIFAGSPAAAVPSLNSIAQSSHEIAAVLTREDSLTGRKRQLLPTPVALEAEKLGLPIIKANRVSTVADELIALESDLGVVVAYGGMIRSPLLGAPRFGWINLHFSLLPRWRGAAPVQHAILNGDDVTGATVFQLTEELDAGPVFGMMTQSIGKNETSGHLLASLSQSGSGLLLWTIDGIATGTVFSREQEGEPTLAPKLQSEDGRIDWSRSAVEIDNQIRAVTPEPGAFTTVLGARFKVHDSRIDFDGPPLKPGEFAFNGKVLLGTGTVPMELLKVQPAGKKPMSAGDWSRGAGGIRSADD